MGLRLRATFRVGKSVSFEDSHILKKLALVFSKDLLMMTEIYENHQRLKSVERRVT